MCPFLSFFVSWSYALFAHLFVSFSVFKVYLFIFFNPSFCLPINAWLHKSIPVFVLYLLIFFYLTFCFPVNACFVFNFFPPIFLSLFVLCSVCPYFCLLFCVNALFVNHFHPLSCLPINAWLHVSISVFLHYLSIFLLLLSPSNCLLHVSISFPLSFCLCVPFLSCPQRFLKSRIFFFISDRLIIVCKTFSLSQLSQLDWPLIL